MTQLESTLSGSWSKGGSSQIEQMKTGKASTNTSTTITWQLTIWKVNNIKRTCGNSKRRKSMGKRAFLIKFKIRM